MCCDLNISSLIVELDARVVVDAFSNTQYVNNVISPILDDCSLLSSLFSQIQFKHCYRKGNRVANILAKMSFSQEADCISFVSQLVDVLNAFKDDCNGVYLNRLCPAPFVISQFINGIIFHKKKKTKKKAQLKLQEEVVVVVVVVNKRRGQRKERKDNWNKNM